ncbi:MAG TPA: glycosyltransferase family 9 protein [Trinickia sp.]|jgi:heptosyltransferase-3|uniref:glycosyltransferase family 9 protein n=1 Tax=Trinickia sp. TaxID=2571163 RepID=UPI002CD37DF5|nr:glycosyltransferase family 9 protein [Trinickia sp.]HTI18021.1 glycosyltransferase family 9 protein [Trinickia sp.]
MITQPAGSASVMPAGRIALIASNAIGDTLVLMVIVQNLLRNGVDVTVFGQPAYALRQWFPGVAIEPLPAQSEEEALLAQFDTVLQMHTHQPIPRLAQIHPRVCHLDAIDVENRPGCMAENFADFCRRELGLQDVRHSNGMMPPSGLMHRCHVRRVAIHPEASTQDKRWLPERFLRLAVRLRKRGYDVQFIIAPHERERWCELERWGIPAPTFANLHELASWLYESGWFIGNDSGMGHLASSLNVPTISLFRRRRVSERWRPAWGTVDVVLPWQWLPFGWLKEKLWRETLTCARVLSAFNRMVRRYGDGGHPMAS